MQFSVERDPSQFRGEGEYMLLPAKDGARRRYTIAVPIGDWGRLCASREDAISEVEYLALSGRWASHNGQKVWSVSRR